MKLINKTNIPNEFIEPLLKQAGIQSGCRTSKTYIKISYRNSYYSLSVSGKAYNYTGINDYYLTGNSKRILVCDGYITMILPNVLAVSKSYPVNYLTLSENIYSVAVHEFAHIKDFQHRITNTYKNRNKPYKSRPCEILARKIARQSMNHLNSDRQDLILNLAIWLENYHKTHEYKSITPKYFVCTSCNKLITFGKRLPSYAKNGFFSICQCGNNTFTQCVSASDKTIINNGIILKSVHGNK